MNARLSPLSLFLPVTLLLTSCLHPASKLPTYAHVPDFSMTDSSGQVFPSSQLAGKVWVADFIYTNCPAECPMMTARMKTVSRHVKPDVELVSISVDPDHDTPAALKTFAARYGEPTAGWVFLTGSPETVHLLAWSTFHVGDLIGRMEHSTKFTLVDRKGFIRGYYSSLSEEGLPALLRDTEALRQDKF